MVFSRKLKFSINCAMFAIQIAFIRMSTVIAINHRHVATVRVLHFGFGKHRPNRNEIFQQSSVSAIASNNTISA